MNDQRGQYQQQGGYDERGDGRDRRDEYESQQSYQQQQPTSNSPPTSASPFAFAPPPLSLSRPQLPLHHSEPAQQFGGYYPPPKPPQVQHHNTFPGNYATSAPMGSGYRSYSNDTRQSPQQQPMTRTPSLNLVNSNDQPSPSASSPFQYQRQVSNGHFSGMDQNQSQQSPQRPSHLYGQQSYYAAPYNQPTSADMPRSISYPSSYAAPYPYLPSMSAPSLPMHQTGNLPPLNRHNTTSVIDGGLAGMDLGRQAPNMGYTFANRLPLVDRPFKCDECVQSFNRNHDLKRHKRIHLSVKPFGCEKCGKTFSRKDALRRHWLVKGCRGEEGATAPITPMFPLNFQTPGLSPPTPTNRSSPPEAIQMSQTYSASSYSHPSAPPPLPSIPDRQASGQSQMLVTPNDVPNSAHRSDMGGSLNVNPPLDEPILLDSSMIGPDSTRGSGSSLENDGGYFEGVVGLKQDGTAVLDGSGDNSPYSRYASSPISNGIHPHPYRRPMAQDSPDQYAPRQRNDGKPVFAMPFTPSGQGYMDGNGMLAPPMEGIKMEKRGSFDGAPVGWQRWHRPSFPFPPPPGSNYNFTPESPVDVEYTH